MSDMNDVQLRRLDAGLLLTFEAVLRERNLAKAGAFLRLTPSAVSHALARLRDIFGDPLFVRRAQGVIPTPRALALRAPIAQALATLRGAFADGAEFRPETIDRLFQLAALDAAIASLAPSLLAKLAEAAPRARIAFRSFGREETRAALRNGRIDLAIGVFGPPSVNERRRLLSQERFVVVARRDHPALRDGLSLEDWLAYEHVLVSAAGDLVGAVDTALAARGLQRRTRAAMPQFLAAFATVAASDVTATVTEGLARRFAEVFGLAIHDPPVSLDPFELSILRLSGGPLDPALDWLEETLVAARAA
jgi:DNA-binding transcriptional LysR family regulator